MHSCTCICKQSYCIAGNFGEDLNLPSTLKLTKVNSSSMFHHLYRYVHCPVIYGTAQVPVEVSSNLVTISLSIASDCIIVLGNSPKNIKLAKC